MPERRHLFREHVEAVVEVLAKPPGFYVLSQIHLARLILPNALLLLFFEDMQQLVKVSTKSGEDHHIAHRRQAVLGLLGLSSSPREEGNSRLGQEPGERGAGCRILR